MLNLLLLASTASAQDSAGAPLAIPTAISRPRIEVRPPPPRTQRPVEDLLRARAQRAYLERYLSLREVVDTDVQVSYATTGWIGPRGRFSYGWMPYATVVHNTELAVFRGTDRIDVPATLGALGEVQRQAELQRKIDANRSLGDLGFGVGVAGLAASVVSAVQLYGPEPLSLDEARTWSSVGTAGIAMMVGGFLGGAIPSGRAQRLQVDPQATFDPGELEAEVVAHNERLAAELGLPQTDAVQLERR